jgi:hypothetical protein
MPRWTLAAVAVAGLALAAGCGRGGPRISSLEISAGGREALLDRLGLDRPTLEAATRQALAGAGFRQGDGPRSYRARATVVSVRAGRQPGREGLSAELVLDLELRPVGGKAGAAPVAQSGMASVPAASRLDLAAWRAALDEAAHQASAGLALALTAERKSEDRLIADLSAQDPRLREQAIRVLAGRRSARAVPALIERLDDPEPDLVERAAGALTLLRDPRAVGALIDLSRRRDDPAQVARFARLIGDVGGAEARGYLETLESGHPDPRVRAAAIEALQDLAAREQEQGRVADGVGPAAGAPDSGRMGR